MNRKEADMKKEQEKDNFEYLKNGDMDINAYIKYRLIDQIQWYDTKAVHCRSYHEGISIAAIILTAGSSFLALLSASFPAASVWLSILAALCGSATTILLAIDKLKKYQELHSQYRGTCEKLKQEIHLYRTKTSDYRDPDKDPMTEDLFIERCESIMATENGTWAQLNEKKEA